MKTKTLIVGLIACACAFFMTSCGDEKAPKEWNMEIEDSFRAQVACGIMYALYDEESLDGLADKLDDGAPDQIIKHLFEKHIEMYKLTLEEEAGNDPACEQCLAIYNALEVKFGKWEKQADQDGHSVWVAVEENSDIHCTFLNNEDFDWDLNLDDDDYTAYCDAFASVLAEED